MTTTEQWVTNDVSLVGARQFLPAQGAPAILGYGGTGWGADERWRVFGDADEVADVFAEGTPEHSAASAMFAQKPSVSEVVILRGLLPPTQRHKVSVKQVSNSAAYKVRIGATTITFTSDSSAANDEIVTGLANAVTAEAIAGITASSQGSAGSTYLRLLANSAGAWFDVEVLTPSLLSISLDHADPGVATDLSAIEETEPPYYFLYSLYNSDAVVAAAAGWAETHNKCYLAELLDSSVEDTSYSSATDAAKANVTATRQQTVCAYHHNPGQFFGACVLGVVATYRAGQRAWAGTTLVGPTYRTKTAAQVANLKAKRCGYLARIGPSVYVVSRTFRVGSGPFIEAVVGVDAWLRDATNRVTELLARGTTGLDDDGLGRAGGEIQASIKTFVGYNFFLDSPPPLLTIPTRGDLTPEELESREVTSYAVSGALTGFLQGVHFKATITVA